MSDLVKIWRPNIGFARIIEDQGDGMFLVLDGNDHYRRVHRSDLAFMRESPKK